MRPFLKWAGNKYQIVSRITEFLPPGERLVEPFVGSAALFLNSDYPRYLLADANGDLINLYRHLQREGEAFIAHCRELFVPENNVNERYYELRTAFNAAADGRDKAALFLYLNKHGYNGLCRYNSKGGFNVPFGRYRRPYFPEKEMRHFLSKAERAEFVQANFAATMAAAAPGDVVYADPPYHPLSATANFTSYHAAPFGEAEQRQLAQLAAQLAQRGVPSLLSNHDAPFIRELYAGAEIRSFAVQRYISCQGNARNKAQELLALFRKA
jgi:DNA adenine methylase